MSLRLDPTGLADVRAVMRRETDRRWTALRRHVRRAIVGRDALAVGATAPALARPTAEKAHAFHGWLSEQMSSRVGAGWMDPHLATAASRAALRVGRLVGVASSAPSSLPVCRASTALHAGRIAEDAAREARDAVGSQLLAHPQSRKLARAADAPLARAHRRARVLAEHAATQAYTQASLDAYEAAGVTAVGSVAEHRAHVADGFDPDEPRDDAGKWTGGLPAGYSIKRDNLLGKFVVMSPKGSRAGSGKTREEAIQAASWLFKSPSKKTVSGSKPAASPPSGPSARKSVETVTGFGKDEIEEAYEDFESQGFRGTPEEAAALEYYVGGAESEHSGRINQMLRSGRQMTLEESKFVELLRSGLSRSKSYIGTVLRGTELTPEQLAAHVPGKTVIDPGFMSTSRTDPWVSLAPPEPGKENVLFTIETRHGVDVEKFNPGEGEVIILPGTKMTVLSHEIDEKGTHRIRMKDAAPVRAAGILHVDPQNNGLFLHRTDGLGWALPGGGLEPGEEPEHAAVRETLEETGGAPTTGPLSLLSVSSGPVEFSTFRRDVPAQFGPMLNHEHDAAGWFPLSAPPEPLHPGVRWTLRTAGLMDAGPPDEPRDYKGQWTSSGGETLPAGHKFEAAGGGWMVMNPSGRVIGGFGSSKEEAFESARPEMNVGKAQASAPVPGKTVTVYHGTSGDYLKSIIEDGIVAAGEGEHTWPEEFYDGDRQNSVFVTKDIESAAYYAGTVGHATIIEVRIPASEWKRFKKDKATGGKSYYSKVAVKPEHIVATWAPLRQIEDIPGATGEDDEFTAKDNWTRTKIRDAADLITVFLTVPLAPRLADAYDPDEQRDERGRWTAAGLDPIKAAGAGFRTEKTGNLWQVINRNNKAESTAPSAAAAIETFKSANPQWSNYLTPEPPSTDTYEEGGPPQGDWYEGADDHIWAYHGTTKDVLSDIMRDGIKVNPTRNFDEGYYTGERGQSVYVTNDMDRAQSFAEMSGKRAIVLEVHVPKEEWKKFKADELYERGPTTAAARVAMTIPPEWIKRATDDMGEPINLRDAAEDDVVKRFLVIFVDGGTRDAAWESEERDDHGAGGNDQAAWYKKLGFGGGEKSFASWHAPVKAAAPAHGSPVHAPKAPPPWEYPAAALPAVQQGILAAAEANHGAASWTPPATDADWASVPGKALLEEPRLERDLYTQKDGTQVPDKYQRLASGVIVREPDGKVWLVHPTNAFGGYRATFPKGGLEKGLSPQANAIKEAYEETGLKVRIVGLLGDFRRTTSKTRYYEAVRETGNTADHGPETHHLSLVDPADLHLVADNETDRPVIAAVRGEQTAREIMSMRRRRGAAMDEEPRDDHGRWTTGAGNPVEHIYAEGYVSGVKQDGKYYHVGKPHSHLGVQNRLDLTEDDEPELGYLNTSTNRWIAENGDDKYNPVAIDEGNVVDISNTERKVRDADAPSTDHDHDVPELSCMSADGGTFYWDRRLPPEAFVAGREADVPALLEAHETAEFGEVRRLHAEFIRTHGREPTDPERVAIYERAHHAAGLPAERAEAARQGIDWKRWNDWCGAKYEELKSLPVSDPVPDPHVRPAPHSRGDYAETLDAADPPWWRSLHSGKFTTKAHRSALDPDAEWEGPEEEDVAVQTAEDALVCQACEDIADSGPYDIATARDLIPAHIHCRCVFVPA